MVFQSIPVASIHNQRLHLDVNVHLNLDLNLDLSVHLNHHLNLNLNLHLSLYLPENPHIRFLICLFIQVVALILIVKVIIIPINSGRR